MSLLSETLQRAKEADELRRLEDMRNQANKLTKQEMLAIQTNAGLVVDPEDIKEEEGPKNFLAQKFTLFSVPTVLVFLQGPVAGLPDKNHIESNWREYLVKAKTVRTGYRGTITPAAKIILDRLATPESIAKLYKDKDYHRTTIALLMEEGLPVNTKLVATPVTVLNAVMAYWEMFSEWLGRKGFATVADWEATLSKDLTTLSPLEAIDSIDWSFGD